MASSEVIRIRTDTWYDYLGIVKSFIWDDPIEIDEHLFLGNLTHCASLNCLYRNNIRGVVNVTNTSNFYPYLKDIEYFNIPINDLNGINISKYLEEAYTFIDSLISQHDNVLVHCLFGRSRSVAICVYYLMKKYSLSFEQAYQKIENKKPFININQSFVEQLKQIVI